MELVSSEQDIRDNLEVFDRKLKGEHDASGFYHQLVKRGKSFVSYTVGSEWRFAPSRYIGYKNNSKKKHLNNRVNGGATNDRISKFIDKPQPNDKKSKLLKEFSEKIGITPNKNEHKFFPKSISLSPDIDDVDPIEIPENAQIFEGATKRILVNAFERSSKLRKQCVEHWGSKCSVCGFDFSATYGKIGQGFIHVHHIVPLASIRYAHQVDPVTDLIPVCPNCHAMLHHDRDPDNPRCVEELKNLMENARKKRQDS